jgi:hypothetical protein
MFTGDDYHYADLIVPKNSEETPSMALLGILPAIAPIAHCAMKLLDAGNVNDAREMLRKSEPFSQKVFEAPANRYPAGIAFMAYLNGHQDHPFLFSGREGLRSIVHYSECFRLAIGIGLIQNADLAVERFRPLLESAGFSQR